MRGLLIIGSGVITATLVMIPYINYAMFVQQLKRRLKGQSHDQRK